MDEKPKIISNFEIYEKHIVVFINPRLYDIAVIQKAAYSLTDRAYIILTGDPDIEVLVEIHPKNQENLLELGRELNNELLNYAVYLTLSEENKSIRDELVKAALEPFNTINQEKKAKENREILEKIKDELKEEIKDEIEFGSYKNDPENIKKPWTQEDESP